MPELILGGADLAAIAAVACALGITYMAYYFVNGIAHGIDVQIPVINVKPFHKIYNLLESTLLHWLEAAITAMQQALADLVSGLVWLVDESAQAVVDVAAATESAFDYLTHTRMPNTVNAATGAALAAAQHAENLVTTLRNELEAGSATTSKAVARVVGQAESYTDAKISDLRRVVTSDVSAGVAAAEKASGQLIGSSVDYLAGRINGLQSQLDNAVQQARAAAVAAVGPAVHEAVSAISIPVGESAGDVSHAIGSALTGALASGGSIEQAIAHAVSTAVSQIQHAGGSVGGDVGQAVADAISAALALGGTIDTDIRSLVGQAVSAAEAGAGAIPIDLQGLLTPLEQQIANITSQSLPQLALTVAGVATSVAVLEAESGLDDPACRAKHKQICGVDPSAWEGLLGGVAAVGLTLDFNDLVDTGRELLHALQDGGDALGIFT